MTRLEIHLVGGDESLAMDLRRHHDEVYQQLTNVEMPVRDAVNLEKLLHAKVFVRGSEEILLQDLTQILEECRGMAKIPAIKHLRERIKCSLKTAKYLMDEVQWCDRSLLEQKDKNIQTHKDFIQKILEIFGMNGYYDEVVVLADLRAIKNRLDDLKDQNNES